MIECLVLTSAAHLLSALTFLPTAFFPVIYWACDPFLGLFLSIFTASIIAQFGYLIISVVRSSRLKEVAKKFNQLDQKIHFILTKPKENFLVGGLALILIFFILVFLPPLIQGMFVNTITKSNIRSIGLIFFFQTVTNSLVFAATEVGFAFYENFHFTIFF